MASRLRLCFGEPPPKTAISFFICFAGLGVEPRSRGSVPRCPVQLDDPAVTTKNQEVRIMNEGVGAAGGCFSLIKGSTAVFGRRDVSLLLKGGQGVVVPLKPSSYEPPQVHDTSQRQVLHKGNYTPTVDCPPPRACGTVMVAV